ncbi:hypothetical protein GCM10020000_35760 [Streptomyces olivoverticillatus]
MTIPAQSQPIAARRTYLIGRARPNAVVGKNRETGEIALIIAGAFIGMMCGLLVPILPLRIVTLSGFPALALAAVYVPYKNRTFYKWFEINRTYKRTLRRGTTYRSSVMEASTRADGREVEVGPPPGIGRINWLAAPFGPDEIAVLLHADRRTVTAAIEIEGPGVGLRDSEDQEALVERFGTLLKHVANGDGYVTRLQILARTLPADPDAHAKDVERRGDDTSPDWLKDSYDQLQSMVSTSSEQHRAYLVACMHYSRELASEAQAIARASRVEGGKRRIDRDAGLAVVMARELTDICARLAEADIRVRQPLGQGWLASLVHSMYDPDHPIDHIQAMTKRNAWSSRAGRDGADVPAGEDARVEHARALVPRHGLGEGVADDAGGRQLPRPAARPHPGRDPHGRGLHGPGADGRGDRAHAHREDERRRRRLPRGQDEPRRRPARRRPPFARRPARRGPGQRRRGRQPRRVHHRLVPLAGGTGARQADHKSLGGQELPQAGVVRPRAPPRLRQHAAVRDRHPPLET